MNARDRYALHVECGKVLLFGIEKVRAADKFTGPGMYNTFHATFPMPDGQWYKMTLRAIPAPEGTPRDSDDYAP